MTHTTEPVTTPAAVLRSRAINTRENAILYQEDADISEARAREYRAKAKEALKFADMCEEAAVILESEKASKESD